MRCCFVYGVAHARDVDDSQRAATARGSRLSNAPRGAAQGTDVPKDILQGACSAAAKRRSGVMARRQKKQPHAPRSRMRERGRPAAAQQAVQCGGVGWVYRPPAPPARKSVRWQRARQRGRQRRNSDASRTRRLNAVQTRCRATWSPAFKQPSYPPAPARFVAS